MTSHSGSREPEDGPGPELDGPPRRVLEIAKAAFPAVRRELALLASDSLVDSEDEASGHHLRFEHPDVVVEIEVSACAAGTHLSGRVVPDVARVALHTRDADAVPVCETSGGHFAFGPMPHGRVRLSMEGGRPDVAVWTEWFRV